MGRKHENAGDRWQPDHASLSALRATMSQFTPDQLRQMAGSADHAAALVAECEITFREVAS